MGVQEQHQLWGGETDKAVENFPISGEGIPVTVVRWLARIKAQAARVNAELGKLEPELADRIAQAADRVADGEFDDQFPIDVFQTGSGTSSNMNANEVIATLAGEGVHPNDHVNMGQSSNDVFPSAVHLAALAEASGELVPALEQLERSLQEKADQFRDIVKSGRTHLMDAVPVTLGQEFSGYAAQVRLGASARRCPRSPKYRSAAPPQARDSTHMQSSRSASGPAYPRPVGSRSAPRRTPSRPRATVTLSSSSRAR